MFYIAYWMMKNQVDILLLIFYVFAIPGGYLEWNDDSLRPLGQQRLVWGTGLVAMVTPCLTPLLS